MPAQSKPGKVGNYAECLTRELKRPVLASLTRGRTGVDRTSAHNVLLIIECNEGHDVEVGFNQMFPPEIVRKKLMHAGWDCHHGAKCPACVRKPKPIHKKPDLKVVPPAPSVPANDHPAPQQEIEVMQNQSSTSTVAIAAATATAQETTAKAKAARRQVLQWLDESFDITGEDQGRYKAGVTDASIAKETGCSEKAVVEIREEFYGKLAKPRELDNILAEVGSLLLAADQLEKNAIAEAGVLRGKATDLQKRLDKISRDNGWS